jgi:hypothetical protein
LGSSGKNSRREKDFCQVLSLLPFENGGKSNLWAVYCQSATAHTKTKRNFKSIQNSWFRRVKNQAKSHIPKILHKEHFSLSNFPLEPYIPTGCELMPSVPEVDVQTTQTVSTVKTLSCQYERLI